MAFTVTDDRRKQLAVYHSLEEWHTHRHIRAALTGQMAEAASKLALFVGLDAYHAAGGVSRADLFGDQVYLEDAELLNRLAADKLEAIRQELEAEGWKWVEASPERDWEAVHRCGRIYPLQSGSDEPDDEQNEAYDPEQMRQAGCYVSIDGEGELAVEKGLVRREDMKRVFASEAKAGKAKGDLPATLCRDLAAYRQQAAQAELASNRLVAFDLLTFCVASGVFGHPAHGGPDVFFRSQIPAVKEQTRAGDALKSIEEGLPLAWLRPESEAERFEDFCRLSDAEKLDLLAYCMAATLKPQLGGEGDSAYELALSLTGGSMAAYWRPAKANYLGRVSRDQLLALGRDLLGEQWSQSRNKDKKGELADQLERVFAEPEKHARNAQQLEKLTGWLPTGMAFGLPAEPIPTKARRRKKAA